jgi:hypothetical protein
MGSNEGGGRWFNSAAARKQTQMNMQSFMKAKQLVPPVLATLASLVLACFVTAATLGSPTASLAAAANDPTDGKEAEQHQDECDHQQEVNKRTQCVSGHQAKQPQDD